MTFLNIVNSNINLEATHSEMVLSEEEITGCREAFLAFDKGEKHERNMVMRYSSRSEA